MFVASVAIGFLWSLGGKDWVVKKICWFSFFFIAREFVGVTRRIGMGSEGTLVSALAPRGPGEIGYLAVVVIVVLTAAASGVCLRRTGILWSLGGYDWMKPMVMVESVRLHRILVLWSLEGGIGYLVVVAVVMVPWRT